VGTLYVFPGFATYEYPVEITLYSAGQKIKSYKYSYTAGFSIGWLMMPLNLIVTPFNENLSATDDGRMRGNWGSLCLQGCKSQSLDFERFPRNSTIMRV
jgi:hypothetical protein